jgi:hypothetical protein
MSWVLRSLVHLCWLQAAHAVYSPGRQPTGTTLQQLAMLLALQVEIFDTNIEPCRQSSVIKVSVCALPVEQDGHTIALHRDML